jgi:RNA-directed DNA polymerase
MSFIEWKEVNWPLVNSRVLRYQTRIFKAARENNIPKMKGLQKRLLNSFDAKLVAVRQITTLNKGRKTPGVDKQIFVTDLQKGKLAKRLRLDGKASPIRRVYIEKPGRSEKRPLGIPTAKDRAKQALCKLALEPQWEARFEANSYGSRPGRCCQDAMEAIFRSLRNHLGDKDHHKYVLDTEIEKCFDQIDHDYLLNKLGSLPEIKRQVEAWLKAGILEEFLDERKKIDILENIAGTPQGGVISPLLFNIALHGLENHMKEWITTKPSFGKAHNSNKTAKRKTLSIIRYVDDLVVIHKNEGIIREAKEEIAKWLWNGPRLRLSKEKTFIRDSNNSFNFLGFTFVTVTRNKIPRIKIYPSRKSQTLILLKVRDIIQRNRSASAYNLINTLRPIIIGWANYYKYCECTQTFSKLTYLIFQKLRAWVFRRDTRNGRQKVKQRYFPSNKSYSYDGTIHHDNWVLNGKQLGKDGTPKENWLPHMIWVKSKNWTKIQGVKSPFDGDNLYWAKRTIMDKDNWNLRQRRLIKIQKGYCTYCKTRFLFDSEVEVDHIIPHSMGGKDVYKNLQLLHKHCHVNKTKIDGSMKNNK